MIKIILMSASSGSNASSSSVSSVMAEESGDTVRYNLHG